MKKKNRLPLFEDYDSGKQSADVWGIIKGKLRGMVDPGDATINPETGFVDVNGGVFLYPPRVTESIPVKFGNVEYNFVCHKMGLKSLRNSPMKVGGHFYCEDNQLSSLVGSPYEVGLDFNCSNNPLSQVQGMPKRIGGDFICVVEGVNPPFTAVRDNIVIEGDFVCHDPASLKLSPSIVVKGEILNPKQKHAKNWGHVAANNVYGDRYPL